MSNSVKRRADWQMPLLGILAILAGGMMLISPMGMGTPNLYGFALDNLPITAQDALKQIKLEPDNPSVVLNAAEVLIEHGRLVGNSATVAAADAMLVSFPSTNSMARALRLRAIAQQYLHNFDEALALIAKSLEIDSSDATVFLTRANILVVQGKLGEAQRACRAIASALRYDLFILCDTTVRAIGPQASVVAWRLRDLLDIGRMDSALTGYAYSVLGEIAMFQGDDKKAQKLLEKAQTLDPENLRIRMLHADSLLNLSKYREALMVLYDSADTDALLVRRAIAYKHSGNKEALARAVKEIERRIQGNIRAQHTGHAREESLYYLEVLNEPLKALERANINWTVQREFEDARLLLDAAISADSIDDVKKIESWMREENVTAPELVIRLNKAGLHTDWAEQL